MPGVPPLVAHDDGLIVLLDPDIAVVIYVACDIGVYRSIDGANIFSPMGSGLPTVIVHSIRLIRSTRTLRVATYGRGLWETPVPATPLVKVNINSASYRAPFSMDGVISRGAAYSWYPGETHTITWLNENPSIKDVKYRFENWLDGSTDNPRQIVVPSSSTGFYANVQERDLIQVDVSPIGTGTVALSPTSADDYYDRDSTIQLNPIPKEGYLFYTFSEVWALRYSVCRQTAIKPFANSANSFALTTVPPLAR